MTVPSTPPASIGLVTGLAADASPGESLAPWTSLRVGGPAELLVRPRTAEALVSVLSRARAEGFPVNVELAQGGRVRVDAVRAAVGR